ncbi:MAG TPA: hypothetical protein VLA02_09800 [Reyranella sp.]|nr:hypothetical protein [Reyranella sp.]
MIRTLAVALTVGGLALAGAAQAEVVNTNARQATPVAYSTNGAQVSEVVIVNQRAPMMQVNDPNAPKPRIWLSMGF